MPEDLNAPGEQTHQQAPGTPATPPQEDYKARYTGAVQKIETLVGDNRRLNEELAAKASEIEQLRSQLNVKDVEKTVAVSERDKQLQQYVTQSQTLEGELKALRALQLKVKVAKELKRPELMEILDTIPALEDEETLKVVMQDLVRFGDTMAAEREKQLMAGITPGVGAGAQPPSGPASEKAWVEHINSLPLGSRERNRAMDEYGDWLEAKHK